MADVTYHSKLGTATDETADAAWAAMTVTVPSLTDGCLIGYIPYEQDAGQAVLTGANAPDLDGADLSYIGRSDGAAGSFYEDAEAWSLLSPAAGSGKTLTINLAQTGQDVAVVLAAFENVREINATVVAGVDSVGTNGQFLTGTYTFTATEDGACLVVGATGNTANKGPITPPPGFTEIEDAVVGTSTAGFAFGLFYRTGLVASDVYDVEPVFTAGASDILTLIAFELLPTVAGASGVGPIIGGRLLTGLINGGRLVA